MTNVLRYRTRGFALLEALIALVLILVGLVAVSQLQSVSLFGAGEGRTRAEAAHLAQQRLEQLRNMIVEGDFTALASSGAPQTVNGVNAVFETRWDVAAHAVPDARELRVWTTWTDSRGVAQRFDLATVVAWDDSMSSAYPFAGGGGNPVAPTGGAERIAGLPGGLPNPVVNQDGSEIYVDPDTLVTYWKHGDNVLMLRAKDGVAQEFTKIAGRVLFDPAVANDLPAANEVLVRLSSEGECVFTNTGTLPTTTDGGFKYFSYTCYVGPGWYGNVGVNIYSNKVPNVCVGDSGFNGGQANGTTISAHPWPASVRTYRGFRSTATTSGYQSTGVKGGTQYGTIGNAGPDAAMTFLNHDFLLTKIPKKGSCATQMPASLFAANAGSYVCITPDQYLLEPDRCPSVWPLTPTSGGGTVTYELTVTKTGSNGFGTVTSNTGGISCGNNCSAVIAENTQIVLTAAALSGSVFDGWTNCPSGNTGNTCTVTMFDDVAVGALFSTGAAGTPYALTVGTSGSGTVASNPSGINNCGGVGGNCSSDFLSGTSVTLTATPNSGQSFLGWTDCPLVSGNTCTVTMSDAPVTVEAAFSQTVQSCTTTVSGSRKPTGNLSVSPTAGASCVPVGTGNANYLCTLVALPGTEFTLRNYLTSGPKADRFDLSTVVTTNCGTLTYNFN